MRKYWPLFVLNVLLCAQAVIAVCEYPGQPEMAVSPGKIQFIEPGTLSVLLANLPEVSDSTVQSALKSEKTNWYDEDSMVYLYQDSVEVVVGGRANCVGRKIGENNPGTPGIFKLTSYFGEDYRFLFPFRTAAGTDETKNVYVLNFWLPPYENGKVLPVKWWQQSSRGRWRWVFPVGTLFGEVLYQKSPSGKRVVFEIRTRKRYLDGWEVDVFRPYRTASSLASAVIDARPGWQNDTELRNYIVHLWTTDNLVPSKLESTAYSKVFKTVNGALDVLPAISDTVLTEELLTNRPFVSTQGAIWKENRAHETYGPSSKGTFGIVPGGYTMGMIPVNEVSCTRCHQEVGRKLGEFEFDIQLYGEIWGEDQIFTWHLFDPHAKVYAAWDDADVSRKINPKMQQAGLLSQGKPSPSDPIYKALPSAFNGEVKLQRHSEVKSERLP